MAGYNTTQNRKITSRATISALALVALAFCGMAAAEQLYVNESGWWRDGGAFNASGTPIQAAVDAAGEGDSIYVGGGIYNENVDVYKRLTLEGEGANVVTVTAASSADYVFEVSVDRVNISGFKVTGGAGSNRNGFHLGSGVDHCNISDNNASNNDRGIYLYSSSNNTLTNNTISNNGHGIWLDSSSDNVLQNNIANSNKANYGIYLTSSSNNTLTNNTANSNNCHGIYLTFSSNNTLTNNIANSNNVYGIHLEYSSNNTLINNTMSGNLWNFGISGYSLSCYIQNMDMSNTVDGKPIYYWVDRRDEQIPDDAGFVGVVNSTNITVKNLTLTNNMRGALFAYTSNSRIENVSTSDNNFAIYLQSSVNNMLQGNTASNNYFAIYLRDSNNNTLTSNTASTNDCAIYMGGSSNNTLTSNTASNNWCGIRISYSSNNTLINNTMSGNLWNLGVYSDSLTHYTQNMDTNNTVDGKTVYYWVNQKDKQIPDDAGFVGVVNSTNITVKNLTLSNNSRGVLFAYTNNARIENVSASNDYYGIYLYSSSNNTLTNNIANSNNEDGIYLHSSNNNTMSDNNVSYNDDKGIDIHFSNNNMLQSNTANSNTWHGICLLSSNNNMMSDNNASSNGRIGISLSSSNNNTLSGNTANSNNYYYGICLHYSNNNNITCNWVQNNIGQGFYLSDSTNNNISYNNIIENGNYDTSTGGWEWQFHNNQPEAVDAKHNYWGAGMNSSTIDVSIYDNEEGGYGEVEFYPFETEPVPCAPTPEELPEPAFTTTDAAIALQIAAGSRPSDLRWDVSGDKRVTSLDALMILQAAAGGIGIG